MSKSTTNPEQNSAAEQLELQTGVKSTLREDSSREIINEPIQEGSPLRIVGSKEIGYCIVFGKFRITEIWPQESGAYNELELNKWTIITRIAGTIVEDAIEHKMKNLQIKEKANTTKVEGEYEKNKSSL